MAIQTDNKPYKVQQSGRDQRRKWVNILLTLITCVFLLGSAATLYVWKVIGTQLTAPWGKKSESVMRTDAFNVVIAGLDEVSGSRHTDSIIVARVDIENKSVGLVFLPRDSRVEIPGHGTDKINAAYAIGGAPLMMKTLEEFLGVEIDYHAIIYVDSFVKIIDAMGGVDLEVEKRMRYRDRAQDLYIDLEKGYQHLNGQKAMQYARFRHDAHGDLGRIERQQKMIKALSRKAFSFDIVKSLPALLRELKNNRLVETNIPLSDAGFLIKFMNDDTVKSNMKMYSMPCTPEMIRGISYVIPDYEEFPYVIAGALRGGYHPDNRMVKIEVANGCGSPGIANVFEKRLSYFGFDVLDTSNADNFDFDRTTIIVYRETPFDRNIAEMLDADVVDKPDPDSIPNMKVIIGKDKLDTKLPTYYSGGEE